MSNVYKIKGTIKLDGKFETELEAKNKKEALGFIHELFTPENFENNECVVTEIVPSCLAKNIEIKKAMQ